MHVYKFRLTSEAQDDFSREIEIIANQTFDELHKFILEEIGFDKTQLASFYLSNGNWDKLDEISLLDMSEDEEHKMMTMALELNEVIEDPHQRLIYVYDFINLWTFYLEIIKIIPAAENVTYPRCTKRAGDPPKQYGNKAVVPGTIGEEEEFENELPEDEDNEEEDGENYDDYNEFSEGFEEIKM
ncbi:MAG: hypothetical protein Q8880_04820 [Bacteroidota bacterium]|nr:hypothetical protein [Bacteroidota bacterium]